MPSIRENQKSRPRNCNRLTAYAASEHDMTLPITDSTEITSEFQKKCLGKMQDVSSKDGRTVLFVSHNLTAVRQLCGKGILLEKGRVAMDDEVNKVADAYLHKMVDTKRGQFLTEDTGFTQMHLINSGGSQITAVLPDQDAFVKVGLRIVSGSNVQAGFTIYNKMDVPLVLCASEHGGVELKRGEHIYRVKLPINLLQPGTYRIEGAVWEGDRVFHRDEYLCQFQVMPARTHEMQGRSSAAQFVWRDPWVESNN